MAGAKIITLTHEGKDYTLEFNRKSVRLLEEKGFSLEKVAEKPVTLLPLLFWGAFLKNKRGITKESTDAILQGTKKRDSLFSKLIEMYNDTVNTLLGDEDDENEADDEGNANWDPNW